MDKLNPSSVFLNLSKRERRLTLIVFTFVAAAVLMTCIVVPGSASSDITIARVRNPPLDTDLTNLPGDLRAVAMPRPSNLGDFVRDELAARALGKALFWDMQVGSDGIQACASCHFRAGADPRSKNQLHPGIRSVFPGPNVQLLASDFPLTRLADPDERGALDRASDSSDVVSSQGIHHPGN